jgi:hypothetical protein
MVGTWCYVHFPATDAERFLRRVMDDSDGCDELHDHVVNLDPDLIEEMSPEEVELFERIHLWRWDGAAHAATIHFPRPWIGVSVHFPVADLSEVIRRVQRRR